MSGYYGSGGGRGGALGLIRPISPMNKRIILALLGAHVLWVLAATFATDLFAETILPNVAMIHVEVMASFQFWTLLSHPFMHMVAPNPLGSLVVVCALAFVTYRIILSPWAQRDVFVAFFVIAILFALASVLDYGASMHVAGSCIGLYFFGTLFEERWGQRRFLLFCVWCTVAGGLLSFTSHWFAPGGVGDPLILGTSPIIFGLLAAYAWYFPNQTVLYGLVVPLKGKYFILIAIAFEMVDLIARATGKPAGLAVWGNLGGAAAGLLLTSGYWRLTKMRELFGGKPKGPKKSKKPHLRIVKDDDDDPPRYLH